MKAIQVLFALALIALVFSCGKKDKDDPVITVSTPVSGTTYVNGDTIHIGGMVTDNEMIHGIDITVTCDCQTDDLLHEHLHPEAASSHFHTHYAVDVPHHSNVTVTIMAEDEAGNTSTEMFPYHIMQ